MQPMAMLKMGIDKEMFINISHWFLVINITSFVKKHSVKEEQNKKKPPQKLRNLLCIIE